MKAFRDTWRDGIHSYLTYLRDRFTVARDLLADSGSIFVQIGDQNVHRVRALMDEVFGVGNFISQIAFLKTSAKASSYLDSVYDTLLWFAKEREKLKYRTLYYEKVLGGEGTTQYIWVDSSDRKEQRRMSNEELANPSVVPNGWRIFAADNLTSQSASTTTLIPFEYEGNIYYPGKGGWKSNQEGLTGLASAKRLMPIGKSLMYKRYLSDFPVYPINNIWRDTLMTGFSESKIYVVQTSLKAIQRCLLMTTDPGDLVLDPTCGSGTTAYVAEQWGRRWITIDTSRVALVLARARIMGARYPYYLLADSPQGRRKEAELSGKWLVDSDEKRTVSHHTPATNHYSLRQGFVYQRVPHITLKSIANNAEIDVIWERWQNSIAPLLEQLSAVISDQWQVDSKVTSHKSPTTSHSLLAEWEVPREFPNHWPADAKHLYTEFWKARIARQREIDASIAAKAEFEYLYDKPYEDKKIVRVAGPFTVESLSPHRVLALDEDDELVSGDQWLEDGKKTSHKSLTTSHYDFAQVILENLKTAGVQQAHKQDKIVFTSLIPWPGHFICAEGRFEVDSEEWLVTSGKNTQTTNHQTLTTSEKRAAIFIGPEFGTVSRPDLVAAAREAGDADFDVLITCAFNYDAHSSEFNKLGRIPVLKARMNADLHMADDLKNTGKGNLFVIFGEPDIEVTSGLWLVAGNGRMVAHYDSVKELSGLGSLEEINRVGGKDLARIKRISSGREVRTDQPSAEGSSVGLSEHRGGGGEDWNRRIPPVSERGERIIGGSGNASDFGVSSATGAGIGNPETAGRGRGDQQNARWTQAIAAIEALRPSDFPLTLTTSHCTQITIRGVDVFHPTTGEVRSNGADGIACWFIDTDYNEESFFVRHAYFLGANDPYRSLKTTLKAEINEEAWNTLNSDTSRPFEKPRNGRIAVKVINHLGDEVMKVFRV